VLTLEENQDLESRSSKRLNKHIQKLGMNLGNHYLDNNAARDMT